MTDAVTQGGPASAWGRGALSGTQVPSVPADGSGSKRGGHGAHFCGDRLSEALRGRTASVTVSSATPGPLPFPTFISRARDPSTWHLHVVRAVAPQPRLSAVAPSPWGEGAGPDCPNRMRLGVSHTRRDVW